MTNDPTSAAYELSKLYYEVINVYPPSTNDMAGFRAIAERMQQAIVEAERRGRSMNLTPDEMLLAENKRLREAGDALYEAASYTGRTFDGTHRLLSAAAHYLDTVGKNSGKYQSELQANADGANGRDGENSDDTIS